jgi:hypothetical protein
MLIRLRQALFGATLTHERKPAEVDALVDAYPSGDTTKYLLDFGQSLLRFNDSRAAAIDSKATMLVAYSTAILAFLTTRDLQWLEISPIKAGSLVVTGILSAVSLVSAGLALKAARNWRVIGEATWFPNVANAKTSDQLGRWYLRAIHQSVQDNHRINNAKAGELIRAQLCIVGAGFCLALSFAVDPLAGYLPALLDNVQGLARATAALFSV